MRLLTFLVFQKRFRILKTPGNVSTFFYTDNRHIESSWANETNYIGGIKLKKITLAVTSLILIAGLSACGASESNNVTTEKEKTEQSAPKEKEVKEKKSKDDFVDGPLTEIGQKALGSDKSIVELMNITTVNEKISVNPIEVTIKDIKLLQMSNIDEEQMEYFQLFTEKSISDPLNYIQITYEVENLKDENVGWNGFTHLVLNNGEQIKVNSNNILEDLDSEFYGKVKKESYIGVPYEGDTESINSIKLIVGHSFDLEDYMTITKDVEVTYEFD